MWRAVAAGVFFGEANNMAAVELEWIPETLYNTAISAVVDNYSRSRRDIRSLPENIQFDVYYKVRYARWSRPSVTLSIFS